MSADMIEVIVRDPGRFDDGKMLSFGLPCRITGPTSYQEVNHEWQIVSLAESGSVWVCSRCQRIEERRMVLAAPTKERT